MSQFQASTAWFNQLVSFVTSRSALPVCAVISIFLCTCVLNLKKQANFIEL